MDLAHDVHVSRRTLTPEKLTDGPDVADDGLRLREMAGFQVSLNGRVWVSTEHWTLWALLDKYQYVDIMTTYCYDGDINRRTARRRSGLVRKPGACS